MFLFFLGGGCFFWFRNTSFVVFKASQTENVSRFCFVLLLFFWGGAFPPPEGFKEGPLIR